MNKPVLPVSSYQLKLPSANRSIETYRLAASRTFPARLEGTLNRVAFSATGSRKSELNLRLRLVKVQPTAHGTLRNPRKRTRPLRTGVPFSS